MHDTLYHGKMQKKYNFLQFFSATYEIYLELKTKKINMAARRNIGRLLTQVLKPNS